MDCENCWVKDQLQRLEEEIRTAAANNHKARQDIYGRLIVLEKAEAANQERYKWIQEKLDEISAQVNELASAPKRNWNTVVTTGITAFVSGIVGAVLALFTQK